MKCAGINKISQTNQISKLDKLNNNFFKENSCDIESLKLLYDLSLANMNNMLEMLRNNVFGNKKDWIADESFLASLRSVRKINSAMTKKLKMKNEK